MTNQTKTVESISSTLRTSVQSSSIHGAFPSSNPRSQQQRPPVKQGKNEFKALLTQFKRDVSQEKKVVEVQETVKEEE